jgi:hypothetical protein
MQVIKRTFEATKHPKGSPERVELNKSVITSEYMTSYKYTVDGLSSKTFRTKGEAMTYIDKH